VLITMLIGKLFQIGYTPRGGVAADAPARRVRPNPRPRTPGRDDTAGAVRQAEVRQAEVRQAEVRQAEVRQAEVRRPRCGGRQNRNAGVRSVVIEA
jgi:hypothetical protein